MNILITLLLFLLPVLFLLVWRRKGSPRKLPPGIIGIPIIGQSISMFQAMRTNAGEEWLREKVRKNGPISKLTLFGKLMVFIHRPAANKFIFYGDSSMLANKQPSSIRTILGDRGLFELSGQDQRCVREYLMSFLRPESLKQYKGKIDEDVTKHIELHWQGKEKVGVRKYSVDYHYCFDLFEIHRDILDFKITHGACTQ